jgi:hypothetical protein
MSSSAFSLRLAGAALLLLASAPVAASNDSDRAPAAQSDDQSGDAQTGANGQSTKSGSKERRICRRMDDTGSNIQARKLCLTPAQWKARNKR